ncbi:nuclear transport factor 2 family protein [Novosphingobium mangrovi (ex Huang et al. 2023)]|uniref:SnoaL-like domain-containing protein n=1 Tax=Novosphingobium mangrovi (ex Huang et al. 2023) TaxID=2976432 RepID=A0ABT2I3C6_9SPHN|nr:hypothetical protein [Novosphingobium mangrovi (ex Huang et al. 2023)]MCT2399306.1 hypothetical protein [Novosphingobium mangrovi (ex Huang et al. 2023)]
MGRQETALMVLGEIKTGAIDPARFEPDGIWWSNAGFSLSIAEFNGLLGLLHEQTEAGIAVTPGRVLEVDDTVVIEATSHAMLRNGTRYDNRYAFLFRFEDEVLSEVREYSDTAHVFQTFDLQT